MEDLLAQERDAGLGNGGLGRLAACYLDSSASQELPVWGYGLRYRYGIFQQLISSDGQQLEAPDPWLENSNPWELSRVDVSYEVRFHGFAECLNDGSGRAIWEGAGDYECAVESSNSAAITSVLYPNTTRRFQVGKELRLKQQYFWTAASLADIMRRFRNMGRPITEFPQSLETWPVPLMQHLLPRHMQIICDINLLFLQLVSSESVPQNVCIAHLACIGSRKVNRVAELHSELVQTTILKDFVDFYGVSKFGNVTNGITPRWWLDQCNPGLSRLITMTLDIEKSVWPKDLTKLEGLPLGA
ncbi:UDP-Glycosyltransferase/glycogen phosphorylase [Suillus brevipes Sb2]|nr:UDP-Glycosyltransferase/glycogen phosphorylase [Suillus brevipes Sb2]